MEMRLIWKKAWGLWRIRFCKNSKENFEYRISNKECRSKFDQSLDLLYYCHIRSRILKLSFLFILQLDGVPDDLTN